MGRLLVKVAAAEVINPKSFRLVMAQLMPVQQAIAWANDGAEAFIVAIRTPAEQQPGAVRAIAQDHMGGNGKRLPTAQEDVVSGQQGLPLAFAKLGAVSQPANRVVD
jgi:hypothetical protein